MTDVPTTGQLHLLLAAVVLFGTGVVLACARLARGRDAAPGEKVRVGAKACLYAGILCSGGVLAWHAATRRDWVPLNDNFDALVWLAMLLSLFVAYTQRTRPLRGLDVFLLPVVILLLICGAVFGRTKPHEYVESTWFWAHTVSSYGGFAAFAVAGAVGTMFLVASRRLRTPRAGGGLPLGAFGSLERLEHVTFVSVTLGFALLTIGAVTGLVRIVQAEHSGHPTSLGRDWFLNVKVLLSTAVWVVYALVLHSPINPSFRGRKVALLSVAGFVLMVGTIIAVQFMPSVSLTTGAPGAHPRGGG